jgi:hypothetical protein
MRRNLHTMPLAATLALTFWLAGCGGDGNNGTGGTPTPPISGPAPSPPPPPPPAPPPSPPPPPPPAATLSVTRCLTQEVAPGRSVASLVIPDTLQLNLNAPPGFPNGRRLEDSVVDITLAALLLDLRQHSAATFLGIPLNPPANDRPFLSTFPFIAPPQGNPPIASSAGMRFAFRDDPVNAYVRVDRTGFPATSTALIPNPRKFAFNDASPPDDVRGDFVPDMAATLATLATQLDDDLRAAGLTPCAGP